MAKQKKNSNYSTEKRREAEAKKVEAKQKEKQMKIVKTVALWVGIAVLFVALVIGFMALVGVFDYTPEGTYDASFTFSDGSSVHIELFGNDAPETVKNFIKMCENGDFEQMSVRSFADGLLAIGTFDADGGDKGIKGEFKANGVDNKIPTKEGYIVLNRGEDYDSGYGQFLVLTENKPSMKGEYAVFGKVSDMSVIEKMLDKLQYNSDGSIVEGTAPRITDVNVHAAHDH